MKDIKKLTQEYLDKMQPERKEVANKLIKIIKQVFGKDLVQDFQYGMIGFSVPGVYYHCSDDLLPFIGMGNNKNELSVHSLALGFFEDGASLSDWFDKEYFKKYGKKLNRGKGCFRFKDMQNFPFDLLEKLFKKMDVKKFSQDYIDYRDKKINKKKK